MDDKNKSEVARLALTSDLRPCRVQHDARSNHVAEFREYGLSIDCILPNFHQVDSDLQDVPSKVKWYRTVSERCLHEVERAVKVARKMIKGKL